jgi:ankyrin repeat protein
VIRKRQQIALCLVILTFISGCALVSNSQHRTADYTPVFAAASSGDLATVRRDVEKDPSLVNATEWDHATLLHDSVEQNHQELAKYLLDKGADVNAVTQDRLTALHMASQDGNVGIITLLLERGAKINPVDSKGWTPVDRAMKWGHPDAVEFLRKHGGQEGTSVH